MKTTKDNRQPVAIDATLNPIAMTPPINPVEIMQALAQQRVIFHSEADFQHAFAWEIHRSIPECDIRLEVPVRTASGVIHLDLLARSQFGQMAIELKYKTRALVAALNGEDFCLRSHAAQDLGRYDFFKDLSRIETFAQTGPDRAGYVVFLTNDSAYWKAPSVVGRGYEGFAMNDDRDISGTLCWGEGASAGTRHRREANIGIRGCYRLQWSPYSSLAKPYGQFRYVCVKAAGIDGGRRDE